MARKDVNERRQNQAVDGSRPPEKLDCRYLHKSASPVLIDMNAGQARIALAEAEQASKSTAGSGSSASSGVSESSPSPAAGGGGTSSM